MRNRIIFFLDPVLEYRISCKSSNFCNLCLDDLAHKQLLRVCVLVPEQKFFVFCDNVLLTWPYFWVTLADLCEPKFLVFFLKKSWPNFMLVCRFQKITVSPLGIMLSGGILENHRCIKALRVTAQTSPYKELFTGNTDNRVFP